MVRFSLDLERRRSTTPLHAPPPTATQKTYTHTYTLLPLFLTNPAPGPGSSCSRPDLTMVGVRAFPVLLGFGCSHIMNPSRCARKGRGWAGSCCMGKESKTDPWSVSGLSRLPGLLDRNTWVYIIEGGVRMKQMAAPTIVVKHFAKPPPLTLPGCPHPQTSPFPVHPPLRKSYSIYIWCSIR